MSVVQGSADCFFCHRPCEGNVVEWRGRCEHKKLYTGTENVNMPKSIQLCPRCALSLAYRLIGDAFAADPDVEAKEVVRMLVEDRMR